MKKSMINIITLALTLINLVLTVVIIFTVMPSAAKTNKLITKVAQVINLDLESDSGNSVNAGVGIDDIEYIDVMNGDKDTITVSYIEGGKVHYAAIKVMIGVNKKASDYETKVTNINNGMKLIVSAVNDEALKYSYSTVSANKAAIEKALLSELQDLFQTTTIYSVSLYQINIQ